MTTASSTQSIGRLHDTLWYKLHLTPLRVFILFLVIGALDQFAIGYLTGNWVSTTSSVGVIHDYPHWIVDLIFQPAIAAFFVWIPKATADLLAAIGERAIPEPGKNEYLKWKDDFLKWITSSWWLIVALVLGMLLCYLALAYTSKYDPPPWSYTLVWHRYTIWSPRLMIAGSCFAYSIIFCTFVVYFLNQVFSRFGVRLWLYHGDNTAGLKFIGDFALRMNRLSLIAITFLISDYLLAREVGGGVAGQVNLIIEIVSFPFLVFFGFFAPLYACHRAMQRSKRQVLNQYAGVIVNSLDALQRTQQVTEAHVKVVNDLLGIRRQLKEDIPTLPVDSTSFRAFGLSFLASLLPVIISVVLEFISFLR